MKTAGRTTARRAGLCSWTKGRCWRCSVCSPGAGGAAGSSLHRLCPLHVAEPFLEMNVWDFPVENYFTFEKKKKDKGNNILHTHTHTHTHTEVTMVEALLKSHFLQKASPDPQNWKLQLPILLTSENLCPDRYSAS